jgi:hypothetical protein
MAGNFRAQELQAPKAFIIHSAAPLEMTKQQAPYSHPEILSLVMVKAKGL